LRYDEIRGLIEAGSVKLIREEESQHTTLLNGEREESNRREKVLGIEINSLRSNAGRCPGEKKTSRSFISSSGSGPHARRI